MCDIPGLNVAKGLSPSGLRRSFMEAAPPFFFLLLVDILRFRVWMPSFFIVRGRFTCKQHSTLNMDNIMISLCSIIHLYTAHKPCTIMFTTRFSVIFVQPNWWTTKTLNEINLAEIDINIILIARPSKRVKMSLRHVLNIHTRRVSIEASQARRASCLSWLHCIL